MTRVVLGNDSAVESLDNGDTFVPVEGSRETAIDVPDEYTLAQGFMAITHPQGVWANHAVEGTVPTFVASDSAALAALLADHFDIEIRELQEV